MQVQIGDRMRSIKLRQYYYIITGLETNKISCDLYDHSGFRSSHSNFPGVPWQDFQHEPVKSNRFNSLYQKLL